MCLRRWCPRRWCPRAGEVPSARAEGSAPSAAPRVRPGCSPHGPPGGSRAHEGLRPRPSGC
eukprot:8154323-Alexandrium_andersonii.AAC.1